VITGFLDQTNKTSIDIALEELEEELGIQQSTIARCSEGRVFELSDAVAGKTWIIHPILVDLKEQPTVTLNWENDDVAWVDPKDLKRYNTIPDIELSLSRVIQLPRGVTRKSNCPSISRQ
jgi:8-oxo-dGTP pyrophosphatase MutT (NUDIX family)